MDADAVDDGKAEEADSADSAHAMGRLLAARHEVGADPDPQLSLVNYAESPRGGDWTMRAALVRLAQPEAMRASAAVELIRRLDAALHPLTRALEQHTVRCDRMLSPAAMEEVDGVWELRDPADPAADTRLVDLARLHRIDPAFADGVAASYADVVTLSEEEHQALPLLQVAVAMDELGEVLATWASAGFREPPVEPVDRIGAEVFAALERLGVPRESGPPRRGRRS